MAERFQARLLELFDDGAGIPQWVEVFEVSEYGAAFDARGLARLFPWHAQRSVTTSE